MAWISRHGSAASTVMLPFMPSAGAAWRGPRSASALSLVSVLSSFQRLIVRGVATSAMKRRAN